MKTYFHCSPILLGAGSIIEPGNWGRMLSSYTKMDFKLWRESFLEYVRQQISPDKPSRLHAVFLLESLQDAITYRDIYASGTLVYEVTADLEVHRTHRGCYNFDFVTGVDPLEHFRQIAEAYWTTEPISQVEIVTEGAVHVVGRREK
ncbi:hypothetical protein B375_0209370 [Xylella fastidiosa 6c]|nr:hypothetical protein B375_0209370 [Xylella fastidiosa 6c]